MAKVYAAKKTNLESGKVMVKLEKVIIKTVGRSLRKAIETDTDLRFETVAAMMKAAVEQLHSLGIAHCDVALENFFVLANGQIILGDLEYVRPLHDPAPPSLYRSIPGATTAEDLDMQQLKKELALLRVAFDMDEEEEII